MPEDAVVNAAYCVTACNAYPVHIDILQDVLDVWGSDSMAADETYQRVRAALAAAGAL